MGPVDAIKTCLAKSFQFKGRATRAEFWWFAPIWITFCLTILYLTRQNIQTASKVNVIFFIFLIIITPFLSAGVRRLNDAGYWGYSFIWTIAPIAIGSAGVYFAFGVTRDGTQQLSPLFKISILCLIIGLPNSLLGVGRFAKFGEVIGELLVASALGSNKYGPNPHEVPS